MKGSSRDRYSVGFSLDYRMKKPSSKKIQCLLLIRNQLNHPMAHSVITRACNLMILPYEDGILVEQLAFSKTDRNSAANNPLYEATLANYDWNAYDEITNNLSFKLVLD